MRRCCYAKGGRPLFLIGISHARHSINGFSLFAKELQMKDGVMKARDMKNGHDNMKIVSAHWRQLSNRERNEYNKRAREIEAMKVQNTEKVFNDFNLLMRLLYRARDVAGAGDETFTARMASSTLAQLKSNDKKRLRDEFGSRPAKIDDKKREQMKHISWYFPHMRYFDSFTDMLQSVAPTRMELFIAVSRVLKVNRAVTPQSLAVLKQKYKTIKGSHLERFQPITEKDAVSFEKYCAANCADYDIHAFNIVRLFAQFRGLVTAKSAPGGQEAIQYKMLMEADRFRESVYFKALRNLERAKAGRSADHGTYISYFHPDGVPVPPKTYAIETSLSDVQVATLLAETRFGKSVYDDVIERVSCFRDKESNRLLRETYIVPTNKKKKEKE